MLAAVALAVAGMAPSTKTAASAPRRARSRRSRATWATRRRSAAPPTSTRASSTASTAGSRSAARCPSWSRTPPRGPTFSGCRGGRARPDRGRPRLRPRRGGRGTRRGRVAGRLAAPAEVGGVGGAGRRPTGVPDATPIPISRNDAAEDVRPVPAGCSSRRARSSAASSGRRSRRRCSRRRSSSWRPTGSRCGGCGRRTSPPFERVVREEVRRGPSRWSGAARRWRACGSAAAGADRGARAPRSGRTAWPGRACAAGLVGGGVGRAQAAARRGGRGRPRTAGRRASDDRAGLGRAHSF